MGPLDPQENPLLRQTGRFPVPEQLEPDPPGMQHVGWLIRQRERIGFAEIFLFALAVFFAFKIYPDAKDLWREHEANQAATGKAQAEATQKLAEALKLIAKAINDGPIRERRR